MAWALFNEPFNLREPLLAKRLQPRKSIGTYSSATQPKFWRRKANLKNADRDGALSVIHLSARSSYQIGERGLRSYDNAPFAVIFRNIIGTQRRVSE